MSHLSLHSYSFPFWDHLYLFSERGHHRDLHSFPTRRSSDLWRRRARGRGRVRGAHLCVECVALLCARPDRKSTRLNSSHRCISYAVFCLKKKKKEALSGETRGAYIDTNTNNSTGDK